MVKTVIVSILLSFVIASAWALELVSYHEPKGLEPFHGDVFETVSFQVHMANREDLLMR